MTLSLLTEQALNHWISPSTWDTSYHTDTAKFYQFVSRYQKDHGFSMDEGVMRGTIKQVVMAKGHPFGQPQADFVHTRVALARNVLDFLSATGR